MEERADKSYPVYPSRQTLLVAIQSAHEGIGKVIAVVEEQVILVSAELILQLVQNRLDIATKYDAAIIESTRIVRSSLELGLTGAQSFRWDRTQLYRTLELEVRVHLGRSRVDAAGTRARVATVVEFTALYDDAGMVDTQTEHIATFLIAIFLHVINVDSNSHFKR